MFNCSECLEPTRTAILLRGKRYCRVCFENIIGKEKEKRDERRNKSNNNDRKD